MSPTTATPSHVPPECVVDFNCYAPDGGTDDIYAAWLRLRAPGMPDILWTPHNNGHWIATRAEDIALMFASHEQFSSEHIIIPKSTFKYPVLPQESNPPAHAIYRSTLNPWFAPKQIESLERKARDLAVSLIEGFQERGECEFVEEFARQLPLAIVMNLIGLPLSDRDALRRMADDQVRNPDVAARRAASEKLNSYIWDVVQQRRRSPRDDLFNAIVHARYEGRPYTDEEIVGMAGSVVGGGLDTVAAILGHIVYFLATHPAQRRYLVDHPEAISGTGTEELLRRFAVAAPARMIRRDFEYKGIHFKAGEMIQLPTFLHNLDERRYPHPCEVDFARKDVLHGAFGFGAHRCPGSNLTRVEVRIFLQEWLKRIPEFSIKAQEPVRFEAGLTIAVSSLPLVWPSAHPESILLKLQRDATP